MFNVGDRVRIASFDGLPCVKSQAKYQGVEGVITRKTDDRGRVGFKADGEWLIKNFRYTADQVMHHESWDVWTNRWGLELIDDTVIEEDWS